METLSTPITDEIAKAQSGWCECYDIYLRTAIVTPQGTTSILRLTTAPGGLAWFTPKQSPEASANQGVAAAYLFWPMKREAAKADAKFANDKINLSFSNVTREFAGMLTAVNWYDTPIIVRKVPLSIAGATADDCAIIWSGAVDAVSINEKTISLECSSDLTTMQSTAPRENMHTNCRFAWGDDLCTAIRLRAENYKAKTCGSGSTATDIVSTDLTEDTGSDSSYGTDLVDALADANITASSEGNGLTAVATAVNLGAGIDVTCEASGDSIYGPGTGNLDVNDSVYFTASVLPGGVSAATLYYVVERNTGVRVGVFVSLLKISATLGGAVLDITSAGTAVKLHSDKNPDYTLTVASHNLSDNDVVDFAAGTMPVGLSTATDYYAVVLSPDTFRVRVAVGGAYALVATTGASLTTTTVQSYKAKAVKSSQSGYWKMGDAADWGTEENGYFTIPDAQAGLANVALKPYIQFDFGSAKTPRLWRLMSVGGLRLEELVRKVVFFSSTDNVTWKHETYFELPPSGDFFYDVLIPTAQTAQYWRICIRSRWAQPVFFALLKTVLAYEGGRHWWGSGRITFTSGVLQGISRRVLESYSGKLKCLALPAAPANGDTFTVERGCPRTFNACCERQNWENFGGFGDLPYQTVIR